MVLADLSTSTSSQNRSVNTVARSLESKKEVTYQLPLPLPPFFVLVGSESAWPALAKYFGSLASRSAVPSAMPAWSRSPCLWERVTGGD
jgi:hypothetical protein